MKVRYLLIPWLWHKMAFMKRKTVKFSVDIQICNLSDVPLVNAVVFAKLRLLEGGSFEDSTERVEVNNHSASFSHRSLFACRIPCDQTSGTLEKCLCRISIRKEQKGGKSFYKLGYVDINLSEFAGSGVEGISRSYLLNGYTSTQRLDNSKVCIKVIMCHQSADPFFKVPRCSNFLEDGSLNPEAYKAMDEREDESDDGTTQAIKTEGQDGVSTASCSIPDENCGNGVGGGVGGCGGSGGAGGVITVNERKITHISSNHTPQFAVQLRRFSQDRSAQKIQNTRIDADDVVDKVIAECRISQEAASSSDHHGLSLDKFLANSKPTMTATTTSSAMSTSSASKSSSSTKRSSHNSDQLKEESD